MPTLAELKASGLRVAKSGPYGVQTQMNQDAKAITVLAQIATGTRDIVLFSSANDQA